MLIVQYKNFEKFAMASAAIYLLGYILALSGSWLMLFSGPLTMAATISAVLAIANGVKSKGHFPAFGLIGIFGPLGLVAGLALVHFMPDYNLPEDDVQAAPDADAET